MHIQESSLNKIDLRFQKQGGQLETKIDADITTSFVGRITNNYARITEAHDDKVAPKTLERCLLVRNND